jgi:hypothetical protein
MPENQERLRQSLLDDLIALRGNLDKTWTIILSLPVGQARTNLERIHQSNAQLGLNMNKLFLSPSFAEFFGLGLHSENRRSGNIHHWTARWLPD